jgi:hypothetical protein
LPRTQHCPWPWLQPYLKTPGSCRIAPRTPTSRRAPRRPCRRFSGGQGMPVRDRECSEGRTRGTQRQAA